VGRLAPELAQEMGAPEASRLAGYGDFLVHAQGTRLRFQSAYLDDYDLRLCLDELQGHRRPTLVAHRSNGKARQVGQPFSRDGDEVRFLVR
jgi:hypothetical protein